MLQHRHTFPGWATSGGKSVNPKDPDASGWWHDANMKHTKYPTAHDSILETREFTPGTRSRKAKTIDPLYANPPEYGPSLKEQEAVKEAEAIVKAAEEGTAKRSKNLPRSAKV